MPHILGHVDSVCDHRIQRLAGFGQGCKNRQACMRVNVKYLRQGGCTEHSDSRLASDAIGPARLLLRNRVQCVRWYPLLPRVQFWL